MLTAGGARSEQIHLPEPENLTFVSTRHTQNTIRELSISKRGLQSCLAQHVSGRGVGFAETFTVLCSSIVRITVGYLAQHVQSVVQSLATRMVTRISESHPRGETVGGARIVTTGIRSFLILKGEVTGGRERCCACHSDAPAGASETAR